MAMDICVYSPEKSYKKVITVKFGYSLRRRNTGETHKICLNYAQNSSVYHFKGTFKNLTGVGTKGKD
jgi:hypothetical protein